MEAELTTLDTATVEADWLRRLLNDLPVVEKPVPGILNELRQSNSDHESE